MAEEVHGGGATSLARVGVEYAKGATALSEISLRFDPGEQAAVVGASGAGKSTLLLTLACSLVPTRGRVGVLGVDPWALGRAAVQKLRGRIFLAPQVPPLPPRQRVVHAVLAGRLPAWSTWQALKSLGYPADAGVASEALGRFRLDDKLFLRCDRLSGGERQRVGLARALVSPAELFLLDEPVSALDPALASESLRVLQDEARARGATLVASLHAVDLALSRFPRLIGISGGRVAFDLPREEVTEDLLAALYGAELTSSYQSVDEAIASRIQLSRCF